MSETLNHQDRWLAAEYALGVLDQRRARLAERRAEEDADFREAVEAWQIEFAPVLDQLEQVAPPAAVWQRIEERIGGPAPAQAGLWSSLAFWRWLSVLTGGIAAGAIAALVAVTPTPDIEHQPPPRPVPLVATLTVTGEEPAFLARFDPETGHLVIRTSYSGDAQFVPELWLIPGDGVPRSLGVLNVRGTGDVELNEAMLGIVGAGATLAVSLEPEGGSPTGAPTGPVIASGVLETL